MLVFVFVFVFFLGGGLNIALMFRKIILWNNCVTTEDGYVPIMIFLIDFYNEQGSY
jgi:hypothetical protein